MSKLDEMSRRRAEAHRKLLALDSKVYKAFLGMERATYADGALTKKSKELIAIGISVVINCESCMKCGGPATAHARFALDVMDAVFAEQI